LNLPGGLIFMLQVWSRGVMQW